jgi:hypothetical protein
MQDFCDRRLEARAFTCSQNYDYHIVVRHSAAILSRSLSFDNRGEQN